MKYDLDQIYNEDCYKAIKEIPDKSIDCVYIDIPYLFTQGGGSGTDIGKRYHSREFELLGFDEKLKHNTNKNLHNLLRIDKYNAQKRLDTVSLEDGIDYAIFDDLCRVMKKINIFVWYSKLQMLDIMNYFIKEKKCNFEVLVWAKTNALPSNNSWLSDLEYCLHLRESGVKLNTGYELKTKWYVSSSNKADKQKFVHPTIKLLGFVETHLLHATQPNDVVLDCFLGSGTTAVACKNIGRHYLGFEINKKYFDIAQDRINKIDANGQMSMFAI